MPDEGVSTVGEISAGSIPAASGGGIAGGREMGEFIRGWDWTKSSLGPMESWSTVLLAVVNLVLNSDVPSAVYWGAELAMIYNDGYRDNIAKRHPAALGAPARVVWADLWPRFGQQVEGVLRDGNSVIQEKVSLKVEFEGREIETFWNLSLSPIYEEGRIAGVYKTSQNITEEVNATDALVMSDERLRLALSATNCLGTWDWDVKSDRVYLSERFARVYGMDASRLRDGYPRSEFLRNVHPDDLQRAKDAVARAVRTGEEYRLEYRVCQPDGSVRWVASRGSCIYDDAGEPMRFPGITFDVTLERAVAADRPADKREHAREDGPAITLLPTDVGAERVVELVEFMVLRLAKRKDEVLVTSLEEEYETHVTVRVAEEDLERVVGSGGETAAAMRSLLGAASIKTGRRFSLDIIGEGFSDDFAAGGVVQ
jgi:PAS domain S-box-containing protein